jgi:hypothetical protein
MLKSTIIYHVAFKGDGNGFPFTGNLEHVLITTFGAEGKVPLTKICSKNERMRNGEMKIIYSLIKKIENIPGIN